MSTSARPKKTSFELQQELDAFDQKKKDERQELNAKIKTQRNKIAGRLKKLERQKRTALQKQVTRAKYLMGHFLLQQLEFGDDPKAVDKTLEAVQAPANRKVLNTKDRDALSDQLELIKGRRAVAARTPAKPPARQPSPPRRDDQGADDPTA